MYGRDLDKFRKYLSGSKKEKKKRKREQFIASQKGAFEKFLQPQLTNLTSKGQGVGSCTSYVMSRPKIPLLQACRSDLPLASQLLATPWFSSKVLS